MSMNKPILSFMQAVQGLELCDAEKRLLEKYNPIGVSFFARNVESKAQVRALLLSIKEVLDRDEVFLAVDQEGGRVRRLKEPEWRGYAPQHVLGDESARLQAQLIACDSQEVGLNLNFAPVLDVMYEDTTAALKSRCFSMDEKVVARLGHIMIEEYKKSGICACMKHMPGHGRAVQDPHLGLPVLDYSLKELEKDFYSFKKNADCLMGMTAHVLLPEIDEAHPLTQSKKGIDRIVRGEIGFKGLLTADAMDMKALKGSYGERTAAALEAGCELVCCYSAEEEHIVDIAKNSVILDEKALEKCRKVFEMIKSGKTINDEKAAAKRYFELVGNVEKYVEEYDGTEILKHML